MILLKESKRMWLLPYIICFAVFGVLYYFAWDSTIGRTCGIMIIEVQIIIVFFCVLILLFKLKSFSRIFSAILYLGITIYEGVNGNIKKWYVIIPIFLIAELYMVWNLGGIINCVIASPYKIRLDNAVSKGMYSYDDYAGQVSNFNNRNNLNLWNKVKTKKEPNWQRLGFGMSGVELFGCEKSLFGISNDIYRWNKNENNLNRINGRLDDKNNVLMSNQAIYKEKENVDRIGAKAKFMGVNIDDIDASSENLGAKLKNSKTKAKKVLKRKL